MTTIARCKRSRHALGLMSALLVCLITASSAHADAGSRIIERCTHGQSLSGFRQSEYSQALHEIPTEVQQYTNCEQMIRNAQLAAAGGPGGGGNGSNGSTSSTGTAAPLTKVAATPAQQRAINRASTARSAPVRIGDKTIEPGVVHANVASAVSSLPTPLIAILALMVAAAVAALAVRLRRHGLPLVGRPPR